MWQLDRRPMADADADPWEDGSHIWFPHEKTGWIREPEYAIAEAGSRVFCDYSFALSGAGE